MNKLLIGFGVAVVLGIAGFYVFNAYIYNEKQGDISGDYKNTTYVIDRVPIKLTDGISEIEAALGSSSKIVTTYFGNIAKGDLSGDSIPDLAFLITQTTGGSGTFYYIVASIQNDSGTYEGSNGVFLGDRIAPQTTEIRDGKILVNYADRAPGESFPVPPSIGKSMWLALDPLTMHLGEVAQDFEGEADPSKMTLGMKTWVWVSALYSDGKEIKPSSTKSFTLTFLPNGTFSATTDCNGVGGEYKAKDGVISFTKMMSTLMYCEGSKENEFTKLLEEIQAYHFTSKGELIFELKVDSGTVLFR